MSNRLSLDHVPLLILQLFKNQNLCKMFKFIFINANYSQIYLSEFFSILFINIIILKMQTSYPLKLEVISIELAEKPQQNFPCSISLVKGTQKFGQIKFEVDKDYNSFTFVQQKVIGFSFSPRLTTRRDILFRIVLTDLQNREQLGEITISTHMLAQIFISDHDAILQESKQFFDGATLSYKIYMPNLQLKANDFVTYGFQNVKKNDFVSNLFARPDVDSLKTSMIKKQSVRQRKLSISIVQTRQRKPSINLAEQPASGLNILDAILNKPQTSLKESGTKNDMKSSIMRKSTGTQDFFIKLFGHVRQNARKQEIKKHTLNKEVSSHHDSHKLSIKLKTVIFLLIFGVLMILVQLYQDKSQITRALKKQMKLLKKKNKSKSKIVHH